MLSCFAKKSTPEFKVDFYYTHFIFTVLEVYKNGLSKLAL